MQNSLNQIAKWTQDNQMKLNEQKCNYMIFSRSQSKFATRLHINKINLERIKATKILGVGPEIARKYASNHIQDYPC